MKWNCFFAVQNLFQIGNSCYFYEARCDTIIQVSYVTQGKTKRYLNFSRLYCPICQVLNRLWISIFWLCYSSSSENGTLILMCACFIVHTLNVALLVKKSHFSVNSVAWGFIGRHKIDTCEAASNTSLTLQGYNKTC